MLVHGTAGRVKFRNKIEFQKLICPLSIAINIQIDGLVTVLQLFEADSDRLFRLDYFLGSGHIVLSIMFVQCYVPLAQLLFPLVGCHHLHVTPHCLGSQSKHTADSSYIGACGKQ